MVERVFRRSSGRLETEGFACTVEMAPTKISEVPRWASAVYTGTKEDLVERTATLRQSVGGFIGVNPDDLARVRFHGVVRAVVIEEARARARKRGARHLRA